MALSMKPQSFISYMWDGPIRESDTITISFSEAKDEPSNHFPKLVFRGLPQDMKENGLVWGFLMLDVMASDAKIVEYFYGQAERLCVGEIPFHTRMVDRTALWVRKHVDFIIQPANHDFQRFPNKQLVLGGSLFVHFVIDSKRFINLDGHPPETGIFTPEQYQIISIADNRAPIADNRAPLVSSA